MSRPNNKGKNNPFYGKHHTEETKLKMRGRHLTEEEKNKLSLERIGKHSSLDTEFKKGHITWMKGKHHTKETKMIMSKIKKVKYIGEGNPFYGKHHTKETKLKIKTIWNTKEYKQLARNNRNKIILPVKDTKIEVKIQNLLRELGIDFFTHQYIKEIEHGYQCDILIPSMNLVIECDGNYWHKYPIGNDIDHIRTKELIEKGFKVLRLWEIEIRDMDLNGFKNKIMEVDKNAMW